MKILTLVCLLLSSHSFAATFNVDALHFEESANTAIQKALPGDTIRLPAGHFFLQNELIIDKPGLTLIGAGSAKTLLDFSHQQAGAQGVYGTKDNLTLNDFAVSNTKGNGIKIIGASGIRLQRLRVGWPTSVAANGSYGIYPVLTSNVLVEDCDVYGSSDAGLYVGQSHSVVLRRNFVHANVAGLEVENSSNVDVFENKVTGNTAGVLVFNLPDLIVPDGRKTRVFNNDIRENNLSNFSTAGSIIHLVPSGVGVFLLAARDVEIFDNEIFKNHFTGVAIGNYFSTSRKISDQRYDPMPRGLSIHGNRFTRGSLVPNDLNKFTIISKLLFGLRTPEIIYDGVDDGTYSGAKPSPGDRICINGNDSNDQSPSTFGNLHLDHQRKGWPFPGGPGTRDIETHFCQLPHLPAILLEPLLPSVPGPAPAPDSEILAVCKSAVAPGQINRAALAYDCPLLQDFGLFAAPSNARTHANENGFRYDLSATLFTDYADKDRFIFLPPGEKMNYDTSNVFDFPTGTLISKTFSLNLKSPDGKTVSRQIETRLLYKDATGLWNAREYVWNGSVARITYGGQVTRFRTFPDSFAKAGLDVDYQIPNVRQCASCHSIGDALQPIGPKARFLNRAFAGGGANQLETWATAGILNGLPARLSDVPHAVDWADTSAALSERVRSYLDINCAHCHSLNGSARNTGLFLGFDIAQNSRAYGICKTPVAAGIGSGGRSYDIQPGNVAASVLPYRISQSHLAVKMPQLGRSVTHVEAKAFLETWIAGLPEVACESVH